MRRVYFTPGILVVLLMLCCLQSFAQQDSTLSLQRDSIGISQPLRDSTGQIEKPKLSYQPFQPTKSSLLAVGLSMGLPGAGQLYNEDYWKVPVIWGLGGYWMYEWITLNKSYKDYRDRYTESVASNPPGDQRLLDNRNFYRDERDKFAWYMGVLYFLNVVDAYVGANLYDFEVTPDLGPRELQSIQVRATFRTRF